MVQDGGRGFGSKGGGGGGTAIIVSHGSQGAVAYQRIVTPYNFPENVLFSTRVIMYFDYNYVVLLEGAESKAEA